MASLVEFSNATIVHPSNEAVIERLHWHVRNGETWAIVGPIGSGKSTLAEAVRGRRRLREGTVEWPFVEELKRQGRSIEWPSDAIHLVSFKEQSNRFSYSRHYYQQRFNFIEPDDDLTLDQFLRTHSENEQELHAVSTRLGVDHLRPLSLIKLSNGQTRRARIARALLGHPEWLILDEPFLGLDREGRADLIRHLDEVRTRGTRLLVVSRPEFIPPWVTHVIELGRPEGVWSGPRDRWIPHVHPLDEDCFSPDPIVAREPVIEVNNLCVRHGGRKILDGLNWTVRAGERWALLGPNGSGKSTLISVIYGDHPQVYCNDVKLFGQPRGAGETIWDVKKRFGFVSPEFHLYFSVPLTAGESAATGFFDALISRPTTPEQDATLRSFFDAFGVSDLIDRPFSRLSTGQQRLVLLIRALVKRPEILLLDEPFQGLDADAIRNVRAWLDTHLSPEQTLIFVSHDPREIPRCVTKQLVLEPPPA